MATASTTPPPLSMDVRLRLSVMMFLQFAIWGAWFVVFFPYLLNQMKFSGGEAGWIFGNMALAAIISPIIIGVIADRFIASEKLMALLHFLGAGLLYLQAQMGEGTTFVSYFTITLIYALIYNPTLTLANSIAFTHVKDATRDFPGLRVWGTIGWVVSGLIVGFSLVQASNQPLLLAAVLSAITGVFSLMLPHTPPTGKAGDPLPFAKAIGLFKEWSFAVFFVISGLITVVLAFYYSNTAAYLQQCDARMVPSAVQGYFVANDTVTVTESDPKEKGKKVERAHTTATVLNVVAVTITKTKKDADGNDIDVDLPQRKVLDSLIGEIITVQTNEDGSAKAVRLTALGATRVSSQVLEEEEKDGKKVKEWATVKESDLNEGSTLTRDREAGETLTLKLERRAINASNTMLWGQIAEMVLLPLLPLFLLRAGMKWVLVFGMLCWGLRYLLFAAGFPAGPFWVIFVGILLHGICFDFFFAAGFIHVDNTAPRDIRASAQALFGLLTYGLGMWLGSVLSGYLNQAYTTNTLVASVDWFRFWQVPAYGVIAAVILFALLFNMKPKATKEA